MVKMVALVLNLKTSLTIQLCQQRVGGEEIWSTVLIPLTTNVSLKVRHIFKAIFDQWPKLHLGLDALRPSAIDSDSLEPLSVLHSKLKFEW